MLGEILISLSIFISNPTDYIVKIKDKTEHTPRLIEIIRRADSRRCVQIIHALNGSVIINTDAPTSISDEPCTLVKVIDNVITKE